jgi:hypothetical protein
MIDFTGQAGDMLLIPALNSSLEHCNATRSESIFSVFRARAS